MAVSRGTVMFCCLGTLLVILLFFISAAEAEDHHSEIHAVRHGGGGGCKGGLNSEKGDQCQDDDSDDDDLDDDIDDTYKIVNNVKVSLSSTGRLSTTTVSTGSAVSLDDDENETSDSEVDNINEGVVVLGH